MLLPPPRSPHPKAPGVAVAIDEPLISAIVDAFYAQIRLDPTLGPIFEARITDWDMHLHKLKRFWSSVTLLTGGYKGMPLQTHLDLPTLDRDHFMTWLRLFDETLARYCTPAQAEVFQSRAARIAQSFQLAIAQQRGEMLATCPVVRAHRPTNI